MHQLLEEKRVAAFQTSVLSSFAQSLRRLLDESRIALVGSPSSERVRSRIVLPPSDRRLGLPYPEDRHRVLAAETHQREIRLAVDLKYWPVHSSQWREPLEGSRDAELRVTGSRTAEPRRRKRDSLQAAAEPVSSYPAATRNPLTASKTCTRSGSIQMRTVSSSPTLTLAGT